MTEGGLKRRTQPIDSRLLPILTHAVCQRQPPADFWRAAKPPVSPSTRGSRCELPTKHNCFTKQNPQISEASKLPSRSVPLPIGMTGRNRHSYWQGGGGHAADLLLSPTWIRSGRLPRTQETYLSGRELNYRGKHQAAFPCRLNIAIRYARFFPPFLFEKRKAGAGRGLSGKGKNR